VFGRRRRTEEREEAERRALFAELAKRPDTVCPFLGTAESRTSFTDGVSPQHRCYAFGDPAELSDEQQTKVCLQRGYGNCPRYLRGVLVIPTEELEALRHPQAAPVPVASDAGGGGRRRGVLIAAVLVLLLAGGGAAAAFAFLGNGGVAVVPTPTPTPQPTPSIEPTPIGSVPASAPPSSTPPESAAPTASPTPIVLPSLGPTIPPLPTPGPEDASTGFQVWLEAGEYPVFRLDENDEVIGEATAVFDRVSAAPVRRIDSGGTTYWLTLVGDYSGLAYVRGTSTGFRIYETFEAANGEVLPLWKTTRYRRLAGSEL
jgi:hypothetical protein